MATQATWAECACSQAIWTHFKCDDFCQRLGQNKSDCDTKRRYNFFVLPNPIKLNAASRRQQLGSDWRTATAAAAAAHSILARVSAQSPLLQGLRTYAASRRSARHNECPPPDTTPPFVRQCIFWARAGMGRRVAAGLLWIGVGSCLPWVHWNGPLKALTHYS